jgi:hypothetical protein
VKSVDKMGFISGIIMVVFWWFPFFPIIVLIGIYGINASYDAYAYRPKLSLVMNIFGLVMVILNFFFGNLVEYLF